MVVVDFPRPGGGGDGCYHHILGAGVLLGPLKDPGIIRFSGIMAIGLQLLFCQAQFLRELENGFHFFSAASAISQSFMVNGFNSAIFSLSSRSP